MQMGVECKTGITFRQTIGYTVVTFTSQGIRETEVGCHPTKPGTTFELLYWSDGE